MNENSVFFVKKMRENKDVEDRVVAKAKELVGRNDAVERLADYIQDTCPTVFCMEVDSKTCAKFEHKCGIDFYGIAEQILLKLDPIRLVL